MMTHSPTATDTGNRDPLSISRPGPTAITSAGPRHSAAQAVAAETGVPVIAVANLHDLLAFAGESAELVTHRDRLLAYRASYGSGPTG